LSGGFHDEVVSRLEFFDGTLRHARPLRACGLPRGERLPRSPNRTAADIDRVGGPEQVDSDTVREELSPVNDGGVADEVGV
jgi:hypothetical protein